MEREVSTVIYQMTQEGHLVVEQGAVYPACNYRNEKETAEIIAQILVDDKQEAVEEKELDRLITEAQKELGILLSQKQREAVRMVFLNLLSIISRRTRHRGKRRLRRFCFMSTIKRAAECASNGANRPGEQKNG